jgi:hypothetical protein
MPRGVGYIAGVSLDDLQSQWSDLLDQNVDVILFDRDILKIPHKSDTTEPADIENNKIWQWSQSMVAGQDVSGNFDRYSIISDLQPGDALVLTRLNVLLHANPGAWPEFIAAHERSVQLIILEYGFHSGGEYGEVMLEKMNTMFKLGLSVPPRL